jgi:hypothetical protein
VIVIWGVNMYAQKPPFFYLEEELQRRGRVALAEKGHVVVCSSCLISSAPGRGSTKNVSSRVCASCPERRRGNSVIIAQLSVMISGAFAFDELCSTICQFYRLINLVRTITDALMTDNGLCINVGQFNKSLLVRLKIQLQ